MKKYLLKFARRSFLYYSKDYLNQVIIIAVLAAIITGSLLTGDSVRKSLARSSRDKLGNTYILVSSGLRYFNSSISERFFENYKIQTVPLLVTDGYCQNFTTGATALNVNIYGITSGFFDFHGIMDIVIPKGTIAINNGLAEHLKVKEGDDIVLKFREADPIPENAPFAPEENGQGSKVLKISVILGSERGGNFSLGISQILPQNIFINLSDLAEVSEDSFRVNRLLVAFSENISEVSVMNKLRDLLAPSDIGLSIRKSKLTGEAEIISDRIFIDSNLVSNITKELKNGYPIITYLANSIKTENAETPYSFVSGIPFTGAESPGEDEIIISKWLAQDLHARTGDEVILRWYKPVGSLLEEREQRLTIKGIEGDTRIFYDPSLMPEFPGISGRTSCSSWDAGIPILMDKIRDKDEEYWNLYKGTPKAFVSYETGRKLWGNNFGPATAIRFPDDTEQEDIINGLKGKIEPSEAGFSISNVRSSGEEAASNGVDFGTLFLSLGFFIILSSIILLSFSVSIFFDSKKEQIRIYYALGFKNMLISRMLFLETLLIAISGSLAGILAGLGVNVVIIKALNSVWTGAVQTDTISAGLGFMPLVTGFVSTIVIAQLMVMFRLKSFLKRLVQKGEKGFRPVSARLNFICLVLFSASSVISVSVALLLYAGSIFLSFLSGILLFVSLILAIRQYYVAGPKNAQSLSHGLYKLSKRFYSFFPSQAVTPVIFIAAGIFAIIITSSNRLVLTDEMLRNDGGTGGYLLWAESAIPVKENLNTTEGRKEFGLNDPDLKDIEIVQGLKLAGDDASCLNLNHIKAPPLLGINPEQIASRGSFSFASVTEHSKDINPWMILKEKAGEDIIYGLADQTVLDWGMKVKTGDTLIFLSERGKELKILICGGLKSSIFQGHLIIGDNFFREYFPSVAGSSVFLFDSDSANADNLTDLLTDRFSNYGLSVETAAEKLSSFFVVTNTYLNVFTILGILGLILGVFGLGFMLIRNYDQRSKEFALLMAAGYKSSRISFYILSDQLIVLGWGIITGTVSAIIATLPSLKNNDSISYNLLIIMILSVFFTGLAILYFSVKKVQRTNLLRQLKRD